MSIHARRSKRSLKSVVTTSVVEEGRISSNLGPSTENTLVRTNTQPCSLIYRTPAATDLPSALDKEGHPHVLDFPATTACAVRASRRESR